MHAASGDVLGARLSTDSGAGRELTLETLANHAPPDASRRVKMNATLSPELLGQGTTIRLSFHIAYAAHAAPVPVTDIQLLLPAGLSVASSELGLDVCSPAQLERRGALGCPPNSLMGHGSALSKVPFGSAFIIERTRILLFSGPLSGGHPQLLFLASGSFPVIADLVFSSLVLPADRPFGGLIDTHLPLVPSVPEGPDLALVDFATTIGPQGIVYRERVNGKLVSFRPKGIFLPNKCTRGFRFEALLTFQDGVKARADTTVACPRLRHAPTGRAVAHRSGITPH